MKGMLVCGIVSLVNMTLQWLEESVVLLEITETDKERFIEIFRNINNNEWMNTEIVFGIVWLLFWLSIKEALSKMKRAQNEILNGKNLRFLIIIISHVIFNSSFTHNNIIFYVCVCVCVVYDHRNFIHLLFSWMENLERS